MLWLEESLFNPCRFDQSRRKIFLSSPYIARMFFPKLTGRPFHVVCFRAWLNQCYSCALYWTCYPRWSLYGSRVRSRDPSYHTLWQPDKNIIRSLGAWDRIIPRAWRIFFVFPLRFWMNSSSPQTKTFCFPLKRKCTSEHRNWVLQGFQLATKISFFAPSV